MALAKVHRLHRQDFDRIYRQGKRLSGEDFRAIVFHPSGNPEPHPPRIAVVVSKKVSKRAVKRNRIRRQVQAVLQTFLPQMSWGWQMIILVQISALGCDYAQILPQLEKILRKAGVLDGHS